MQSGSHQPNQGARRLTATRTHPLHSHLTDLLGVLLALLFVCVGGPYVFAGDTPAKPTIQDYRNGNVQVKKKNGEIMQIEAPDGSIIDYSNFDIPDNYEVQFNQSNPSARVLNNDLSGSKSIINGTLDADGQVYIANPAGIGIGTGATIDVGRLVAAAGRISDEAFKNGEDRFTDLDGTVINEGEITAGGVSLLGERVENYGRINVPHGTVTMTAGETVYLGKATGHTFVEIEKTGDASKEDTAVTAGGTIEAKGGSAKLAAGDVYSTAVDVPGEVDVSGGVGGTITMKGMGDVRVSGTIGAEGVTGNGGTIQVDAGGHVDVGLDGTLDVSGEKQGGSIDVRGGAMDSAGELIATGTDGAGGEINVELGGDYTTTSTSRMDVSGTNGGRIRLSAGPRVMTSGTYRARGTDGEGGRIELSAGGALGLLSPELDASGTEGGGDILLGGDLALGEEHDPLAAAQTTMISDGTVLDARATGKQGDGGTVQVWSEESTEYYGEMDARPGTETGEGGFVELSSAGTLKALESKDIRTGRGDRTGTVLLDPKNITITSDPPDSFSLIMRLVNRDPGLSSDDRFGVGASYNNAGDQLAVGAYYEDAVYLFDASDAASPTLSTEIDANSFASLSGGDQFGYGVSFNGPGDKLAVGARYDSGNGSRRGAVYLIDTSILSAPILTEKINDDEVSLTDKDRFGSSVSYNGAGDQLAVGAPRDGGTVSDTGAVYLFDTSNLSSPVKIDDGDVTLSSDDRLGLGVAYNGAGNRLAAGAPLDDGNGGSDRGVVYLFEVDAGSSPTTATKITEINDGDEVTLFNGAEFGRALSFNETGNRLAASAPREDGETGAVYLFNTSTFDKPSQTTKIDDTLTGLDTQLDGKDRFGGSVAYDGSGDKLAVGAYLDDGAEDNNGFAGAVYLFDTSSPASPNLTNKIDDSYGELSLTDDDRFGVGASYNNAGDQLAVGAYFEDAVYLFDSSGAASPILSAEIDANSFASLSVGDQFGYGVSFNGPGDKLAVGARFDSGNDGTDRGAVYLIDTSILSAPSLTEKINDTDEVTLTNNDRFGSSVSYNGAGDQLAVGAPREESDGTDKGAVYLFDTSNLSEPIKINDGDVTLSSDRLGLGVAYNGAGNRLAAGAPLDDGNGGSDRGVVYLFEVDAGSSPTTATKITEINDGDEVTLFNGAEFGRALSFNETGNRLAASAPREDGETGAVYLFNTSTFDQPSQTTKIDDTLTGLDTQLDGKDRFGGSVAYDGSGDKLAVGAYLDDGAGNAGTFRGAVYLFDTSSPASPNLTNKIDDSYQSYLSLSNDDQFGRALDYNRAADQLAVGAPRHGGSTKGAVYLFDTSTLSSPILTRKLDDTHPGFSLTSNDRFGESVSFNGAGDQLAAGAYLDSGKGSNRGAVYLFDTSTLSAPIMTEKINDGGEVSLVDGDRFGEGVSFNKSGDKLAVGAYFADGRVFLFDTSDLSSPSETTNSPIGPTTFNSLSSGDQFGVSVSYNGAGDQLAVGARLDDGPSDNGNNNGAVYLINTSGSTPTLTEKINDDDLDLSDNDRFGSAVSYSGSGDKLAASALRDDTGGTERGAVYVFNTSNISSSKPTVATKIDDDHPELSLSDGDRLGWGVAFDGSGNRLAVGASFDDTGGEDRGAVYQFVNFDDTGKATFSNASSDDWYLVPSEVESLLDGSDLTLQANNDITVNAAVDASGNSGTGDLTLEAGRSIAINNNISLKGAFSATANDAGAIADNRDTGDASLDVSATIDTSASNGPVSLALGPGPATNGNGSGALNVSTLNTGTGAMSLDYTGDGDATSLGTISLSGTSGSNSLSLVGEAGTGSITFDAQGGDDTLTLNVGGGNPIPDDGITYKAGNGTSDEFDLTGSSTSITEHIYTFTGSGSDSLKLDDGTEHTATYQNVELNTSDATTDNVTFNLTANADNVTLRDDDDVTGGDELIDNGTTIVKTEFVNPDTKVTVDGRSGDDTIKVGSMDGDFSANIDVDGGSGTDTGTVSGQLNANKLSISAETININNNVTTTGGGQSYSGPATLKATLQGDGGNITFGDTLIVDGNQTIDTEDDSSGDAGNIIVEGADSSVRTDNAIDAQNGAADGLTLDAAGGTGEEDADGNVDIKGHVGANAITDDGGIIGKFVIESAKDVDLSDVTTNASDTPGGAIKVGSETATTGAITLHASTLDTSGAGSTNDTAAIDLNAASGSDVDLKDGDVRLNTNDGGYDSGTPGAANGAITISGNQIDGQSESYGLAMDAGEKAINDGDIPVLTKLSSFAAISEKSVTAEDTNNSVSTLAVDAGGNVTYNDTNGFQIGTVQDVSGVTGTGSTVDLDAGGAITGPTADDTDDVVGSTIDLLASSGGVGTSSAPLDVNASTVLSADASGGNGGIFLDSPSANMVIDQIDARSTNNTGDVQLDAGSNRVIAYAANSNSNTEVDAGSFGVVAGTGIGDDDGTVGDAAEELDTSVDVLDAENTSSNNIEIDNDNTEVMTLSNSALTGSSDAVDNAGGDVVISDTGVVAIKNHVTAAGEQRYKADVKTKELNTQDGIVLEAGSGLTFTGLLEIGDVPSDDTTGTLTAKADVTLTNTAVLDATLNTPNGNGGDHDRLVVTDTHSVTLGDGDAGTTSNAPGLVGTTSSIYDTGKTFRVIRNDGSGKTDGVFSQPEFELDGQQFAVLESAGEAPGDGNDVVLERVIKKFIWTGDASDTLWTSSSNWEGGNEPTSLSGVIFDTSLKTTDQETGDDPLSVTVPENNSIPILEQIKFANQEGGPGTNTDGDSSFLLDGNGELTLAARDVRESIVNNSSGGEQTIEATLNFIEKTDTFSATYPEHRLVTDGELVLGQVNGTHPVRLADSGSGGAFNVQSGNANLRMGNLGQGGNQALGYIDVRTTGNVDVTGDVNVNGRVRVRGGTVRTPANATVTVSAEELRIDDRLEIGDRSGNNRVGTLRVNGDVILSGDAEMEVTLASSDTLEVNGGLQLENGPTMEPAPKTKFDETASFKVVENDLSDAVSGTFADTTLTANQQEYLLQVNAGDGNDIVLDRRDTERVDPTSGSTDRGGTDKVTSTTQVNATGEDGLNETVTEPVSQTEQETMAGVVARESMDEQQEQADEEMIPEEFEEQDPASSTSDFLGNSAKRNRVRARQLQEELNQLEETGQGDSDEAQTLQNQVDFLTELAERQEQTRAQMTDGQDVSAGGEGDVPHMVGVHDVSPDESLQEITADQLRSQLLSDLQLGAFSESVDGPVLGAILSGLDSQPIEEPPGVAELRDVTRMGAQWANARGDSGIAEQMENVRSDAPWWVNEKTLRFRTGVHGQQAPWGMSVVDVRMSRDTGQYVMHASVWVDEGASNVAAGDLFEQYAGDDVGAYEGSWHTLTLTGTVESQ